jgi:crotonobetainyl-CoA:carnitine CoA-transferase CaiB-like acyl-CoA transferase
MSERGYPLEGVTVLDFGQVYHGPYCGFLLAMAGANVIKIEPLTGEHLRNRGTGDIITLPFAMLNSNKRAITLNLKSERGKELLKDMVKKADVLMENFAPTVMDRLGIGQELLRAINPMLIYASGSGFGRTGPDRDKLAMDLTVQAVSGVMSVTGEMDGPPLKAGAAFCDFSAGIHLYAAITTALFEREKTGEGRLVEVSMEESVYSSLSSNLGMVYTSGKTAPRTGNRHGGLSLCPYNVYECKTGHVSVICTNDGHWQRLCKAMGRDDLAQNEQYKKNMGRVRDMDKIDAIVNDWTKTLDDAAVRELNDKFGIPSERVRDLIEVMNDPHMHERGALQHMDHPEMGDIVVPHSPLRFPETPLLPLEPSALLGAHNDEVYGDWLGLGADEIAALKEEGVI